MFAGGHLVLPQGCGRQHCVRVNEEDRGLAGVLEAQRRYYALRAREYDEGYRRTGQHDRGEAGDASWKAELACVQAAFDRVDLHGDAVELAGGTGVWTERLVCRVDKTTEIEPSTEYETRSLNDGRRFTIIDHPRTPRRIVEAFAGASRTVRCETFGPRFSLTSGTKA
jgi:hypothetical protein